MVSWIDVQTLDGGVVRFRSDDGELMGKEESVSSKILMAYFPAETAESVKSKRELFNALDSYEFESLKARLETMIESGHRALSYLNVKSVLLETAFRIPVPSPELIIPFCDLCTRISETVLEIQPSGPAKISVENLTTTQVPDWFFSADDAGGSLDVFLDEDARDPFYAAQSLADRRAHNWAAFLRGCKMLNSLVAKPA